MGAFLRTAMGHDWAVVSPARFIWYVCYFRLDLIDTPTKCFHFLLSYNDFMPLYRGQTASHFYFLP